MHLAASEPLFPTIHLHFNISAFKTQQLSFWNSSFAYFLISQLAVFFFFNHTNRSLQTPGASLPSSPTESKQSFAPAEFILFFRPLPLLSTQGCALVFSCFSWKIVGPVGCLLITSLHSALGRTSLFSSLPDWNPYSLTWHWTSTWQITVGHRCLPSPLPYFPLRRLCFTSSPDPAYSSRLLSTTGNLQHPSFLPTPTFTSSWETFISTQDQPWILFPFYPHPLGDSDLCLHSWNFQGACWTCPPCHLLL